VADAVISVTWDEAAIRVDTQQAGGPVDRAMSRLADEALLVMKRLAPVYSGPPRVPTRRDPVPRRSGTLRSSIAKFRQPDGSYVIGPTDQVSPGVFLGALIERGTPPHGIDSHGPWPLRAGTAERRVVGRPVYAGGVLSHWHVNHPGTAPHPFIAPAAESLNGVTIHIS
jgi:hypothetical protein